MALLLVQVQSLWQYLSDGVKVDLVTMTVAFDLLFKNIIKYL